jgi:hypothetical protein
LCIFFREFAMKLKPTICFVATAFALGSTSAHAVVTCISPSCITTQTSWTAQQTAGLDEQPTTNSDSGTGTSNRVTSPSDMEQTYVGTAKTSIYATDQTISLQALGDENTYGISTGHATASGSLVFGFMLVGASDSFGIATTVSGRGAADSTGTNPSVQMSITISTLSEQTIYSFVDNSTGTMSYNQPLVLTPNVEYVVDMEASIYTNALHGMVSSELDPYFSTDVPGYTFVFGQGIGNGAGAVPEPSTWAMMLLGFAGLGFVGYRASRKSNALTI